MKCLSHCGGTGDRSKNKIQLVDSEADTTRLWSWSIEWKLMMCSHKRGEYYFLVFSIKQKNKIFYVGYRKLWCICKGYFVGLCFDLGVN